MQAIMRIIGAHSQEIQGPHHTNSGVRSEPPMDSRFRGNDDVVCLVRFWGTSRQRRRAASVSPSMGEGSKEAFATVSQAGSF